jgi:hypothetical protein
MAKKQAKQRRKLESRLARAHEAAAKRARQLAKAETTKGRKAVAKRSRQVAEASAEIALLTARLAALTAPTISEPPAVTGAASVEAMGDAVEPSTDDAAPIPAGATRSRARSTTPKPSATPRTRRPAAPRTVRRVPALPVEPVEPAAPPELQATVERPAPPEPPTPPAPPAPPAPPTPESTVQVARPVLHPSSAVVVTSAPIEDRPSDDPAPATQPVAAPRLETQVPEARRYLRPPDEPDADRT